jgi:hypothetical protein
MASGGIIAFDEGGEIPRFQVGGAMEERLREREIAEEKAKEARAALLDRFGSFGASARDMFSNAFPGRKAAQERDPAFLQRDAVRDRGVDPQSYDPALFSNVNAPVAPAPATTSQVAPEAPKDKKEVASTKKTAPTKKEDPVGIAQAVTDADRYKVKPQYATIEEFMAARKAAEASAGTLPEDEFTKLQRENLTKREARLAKTEEKGNQLAYLQAAGAFFGPGNLLQNAQRGLPAFAEAKIKANSLLDAAQEKVMDAQDAYARYNQARQDNNKKDMRDAFKDFNVYTNQAEMLKLTATKAEDTAKYQDVAGQAALIQANAAKTRAGALANYDKSALTQFQQGKLLDMANDNVQKLLDGSPLIMLRAQKLAKEEGRSFDPIAYRNQLVQAEIQKLQPRMAGGNTMAPASPAGGGSGARFLNFE